MLARVLSIEETDLADGAAVWSCGVPFLVAPVRSADALTRCRPDLAEWRHLEGCGSAKVYAVAQTDTAAWRVRMFAPTLGVMEDPATGSAAAAFAGWLAQRLPDVDGETRITLRQGREVGRPSELALAFDRKAGCIAAVRVGGAAVMVMQGTLNL
jgi:trans-2,3-dihydro-3-hydroxyanthranilate isomerase